MKRIKSKSESRGVRLTKEARKRVAIKETLVINPCDEGLLLRAKPDERISWVETFKEMASEREDWSDFDFTIADGLDPDEKW